MSATDLSRRQFLQCAATTPFLTRYHLLATPEKKRRKIRDFQTRLLQGARTDGLAHSLLRATADPDGTRPRFMRPTSRPRTKPKVLLKRRPTRFAAAGGRRNAGEILAGNDLLLTTGIGVAFTDFSFRK